MGLLGDGIAVSSSVYIMTLGSLAPFFLCLIGIAISLSWHYRIWLAQQLGSLGNVIAVSSGAYIMIPGSLASFWLCLIGIAIYPSMVLQNMAGVMIGHHCLHKQLVMF